MRSGRRSAVARLMAGVAVVAANLAVARALPVDENRALLAGVAPVGIALQAGVILAMRYKGWSRAFWSGYVAFVLGSLASFTFAMIQKPRVHYLWQASGRYVISPGPPWNAYNDYTFDSLNDWLMGLGVRQGTGRLVIAEVVVYGSPQLLIGLAGGLVGVLIRLAWLRKSRSNFCPPDPAAVD